jgi:hypothetical protein
VPTRYEVRGGRLVQHVDHAGADYPVVADPTVSFGWYIYIRYPKAEVQNLPVAHRAGRHPHGGPPAGFRAPAA